MYISDDTEGEEVEEVSGFTNTVNRATSPFIVKMASQVQQIPNDPAVKSLVKSIVKFNDVEYQVPTKVQFVDVIPYFISVATLSSNKGFLFCMRFYIFIHDQVEENVWILYSNVFKRCFITMYLVL